MLRRGNLEISSSPSAVLKCSFSGGEIAGEAPEEGVEEAEEEEEEE